jgi:hypothetical protein
MGAVQQIQMMQDMYRMRKKLERITAQEQFEQKKLDLEYKYGKFIQRLTMKIDREYFFVLIHDN